MASHEEEQLGEEQNLHWLCQQGNCTLKVKGGRYKVGIGQFEKEVLVSNRKRSSGVDAMESWCILVDRWNQVDFCRGHRMLVQTNLTREKCATSERPSSFARLNFLDYSSTIAHRDVSVQSP